MSLPRNAIRLGIGVREGPQTEFEAAAQSYQDECGWTVGVPHWRVAGVQPRDRSAGHAQELGERVRTALGVSVPLFESPGEPHRLRWITDPDGVPVPGFTTVARGRPGEVIVCAPDRK